VRVARGEHLQGVAGSSKDVELDRPASATHRKQADLHDATGVGRDDRELPAVEDHGRCLLDDRGCEIGGRRQRLRYGASRSRAAPTEERSAQNDDSQGPAFQSTSSSAWDHPTIGDCAIVTSPEDRPQ